MLAMSPIRSSSPKASSDLLKHNQTSNGVYPVRPNPVRGPVRFSNPVELCRFLPLTGCRGAEV